MGMFDRPGDFNEDSLWNYLRAPEQRAEDQAIKARRAALRAAAAVEGASEANAGALTIEARVRLLESHAAATETKLLSLALYARTLASLLLQNDAISKDEFESRMREIDALDGKIDGR